MFKKKKSTRQTNNNASKSIVDEDENSLLYPKPRICLFDFSEDTIDSIRSKGFNVTSASLGQQVLVPNNSRYDKHLCLLNHNIGNIVTAINGEKRMDLGDAGGLIPIVEPTDRILVIRRPACPAGRSQEPGFQSTLVRESGSRRGQR